jgi:hypothetical protein
MIDDDHADEASTPGEEGVGKAPGAADRERTTTCGK